MERTANRGRKRLCEKIVLSAIIVLLLAAAMIGADAYYGEAFPDPDSSKRDSLPNQVDFYLSSNPTTGYSWTCTAENAEIVSIRDRFYEDGNDLGFAGAGGIHWFHVSGQNPGTTSITFRYARPWEADHAEKETVYRLTVDEKLNVMVWGVEAAGN